MRACHRACQQNSTTCRLPDAFKLPYRLRHAMRVAGPHSGPFSLFRCPSPCRTIVFSPVVEVFLIVHAGVQDQWSFAHDILLGCLGDHGCALAAMQMLWSSDAGLLLCCVHAALQDQWSLVAPLQLCCWRTQAC